MPFGKSSDDGVVDGPEALHEVAHDTPLLARTMKSSLGLLVDDQGGVPGQPDLRVAVRLESVDAFGDGGHDGQEDLNPVVVAERAPALVVVAGHLLHSVARLLQAPPQGSKELAGVGEDDDPLVAQVLEDVEQCVDLPAPGILVERDDLLQSAGLRGEVHDDRLGEGRLLEAGVENDGEVDSDGVVVEPGDRLVPPRTIDALLVPGHGRGDPADVDVGQFGQGLLAGDRHPARRRGPNSSGPLLFAVELSVPGFGERVELRLEEEVGEAGEGGVSHGPQEVQSAEDVDGQVACRRGRQGQSPLRADPA